MLIICPRCQRRYPVDPNITVDVEHRCNSQNLVLDQEDVFNIGNFTNEDTGSLVQVNNAHLQGFENRLFGTRAWVEGEDDEVVTDRGRRKSTHRQRTHFEFITLKPKRGRC